MNILLTSSGRRSYLVSYFKQALEGQGLVHAANSAYSTALTAADKSVLSPLIYDDNYIDFLINYCKKNNINGIIPLFDVDLPILAKNAEAFLEKGIMVTVSEPTVVNICNDKWATNLFALNNDILVPKTFLSVQSAVEEIHQGTVSFPLMVKPRWGMGSIGLYCVEDEEELVFFYNRVKKDIQRSYLIYESEFDINNCVIIQEKLDGQEYGLDIVNNFAHEYQTTFIKRKIAMRAGETDIAITEKNYPLVEFGMKISSSLRHLGMLDVDVFVKNDNVYLLELNNRFGGGYPFSHLAGANIPLAYVYWLEKRKPPEACFRISYGITGMKNTDIIRKTNT